MDWISFIIEFLESNGIIALFISIIIAFLELVLLFVRTRKSKLEKEFLKLNDFKEDDFIIVYNGKEIPLCDVKVKKKGVV